MYVGAFSSDILSLNNTIQGSGFNFACPGDQIVYWCSASSTTLDWTVVAGVDNVGIRFDSTARVPPIIERRQLTSSNIFVYLMFLDSQMTSNMTIISSQLSFATSRNNTNGSVTCQFSNSSATLGFTVTGIMLISILHVFLIYANLSADIPGTLQNIVINLLENAGFCNYAYHLSWEPPINSDSIDLLSYTVEVDGLIVSIITHTDVSKYTVGITLCPGQHLITLYGSDRCNQTTPVYSLNVDVPQPNFPSKLCHFVKISNIIAELHHGNNKSHHICFNIRCS